ncbi:MAG: VCBS repeat-containing protein [Myxococcaceae bacterium]|nr:VCBS repeat-containing protein [Myxococcaceae bacterium]
MTTCRRLLLASLTLAVLALTACEPPTPAPPELPPPVDRCEDPSLTPVALTAAPATVRTEGAASLEGSGGSGRYSYSVVTNVSGGSISGSRYIAGPAAGTDRVRATDDCGRSAELDIRVQPLFDVQPLRATIRPGTTFTISVVGNSGTVEFAPSASRLASGGTITAAGVYTAGMTPGLDLIVARDRVSGDQVLLQYRVTPTARFRARPSKMAVPTGGVVPLETAEGSGVVTWQQTGGPGALVGGRFTAPASGGGTATFTVRDEFTGETASASIRILTELTRPTVPQGRRSDVATMAVGDFDGDGVKDVALGVPESDLGRPQGGAVFIYKGTPTGLPARHTWQILGDSDTAQLGAVLAVGDLDGDGRDDLAISEPGADITIADSGAVVLYRITDDGPELMRPPLTGLGRGNFGASLAIADVDGDGDQDLVVGSPGADLAPTGAINSRGVVDIFLLTRNQPVPDLGSIRLGGQDLAADGTLRPFTQLRAGRFLVAHDLNGDGRVDLAFLTSVNNSLLGGTALARNQNAIQVHLGREGTPRFEARPDAFVLPINPMDSGEGTWRLGVVPASGGVGPYLIAAADQTDSPNLMAMGGNPAGSNAGGAVLFDLRPLMASGAATDRPTQVGRADAFAQLYGDQANIQAGRSFAVVDLDADMKPELVLGAPYATTTAMVGGMMVSSPNAGRLLVYPLGGLSRGALLNKTTMVRAGANRTDTLGIATGGWANGGTTLLLGYAGRASTTEGLFTGRLDVFSGSGADLSTWTASAAAIPNRAASQGFGQAVDVAPGVGGLRALIGAPNVHGAGADSSGNELGAGQAHLFSSAAPDAPRVLQEGATTRYVTDAGVPAFGGRALAVDVAMTDFDGDGRQDAVFAAPNWSVPARLADGGVPNAEYAGNRPQCFPGAAQTPGGALVWLQRADGTFAEGFRVWAPVQIPNCTVPDGGAAAVCQRAALSRNGLVGGFDFNGDGTQDLALSRTNGLEVVFGRAPDDATLARPSIACDMGFTLPNVPQGTTLLAALGDLNGDGCHELGLRYGDRLGFIVAYGFDPGGTRCGGRTEGSWVRVSGDVEAGLPTLRLGVAMARAGQLLANDTRDFVAVTADLYSFEGVAQPTVLLFDVAQLNARRPMSGGVLVGALGDGLDPVPLVYLDRAPGFGRQLWGGVNVAGDARPDLLVGAPTANANGDGTGAVFGFAAGLTVPGRNESHFTAFPDQRERAAFGQDLAATPASTTASTPAALVIGAPLSYRSGTANGTAFILPLDF